MNEKQNKENNKDLSIKDSDIATIEAIHDLLLDKHDYVLGFNTLVKARDLTKKMHSIIDFQKKSRTILNENDLAIFRDMLNCIDNSTNVFDRNVSNLHEKITKIVKNDFEKHELIKQNSKNILEEANDIIFNRVEEKQREYGPIDESLEDTAIVASIISNESINIEIVYAVLMGLKISRMRWNKKHDTFLDSIGYTAAFEAYLRKTEKQNKNNE